VNLDHISIEKWTNHRIIEECLQSKHKARRYLYDKYSKQMYSISLRYGRSREDADDIFQQSFYLVYKNLGQLKDTKALSGWIKTIFINTAIDHNRKTDYTLSNTEDRLDGIERGYYSNDALSTMETEEIILLIQQLPTAYRKVFNMYVIDGFSHKEIAEKLSISEGTSKSNLYDARRILKGKIEANSVVKMRAVKG